MKNKTDWVMRVLLWASILISIGLFVAVMTSCSKESIQLKELHVSAAYPPFSCTGLNPTILKMKIDGSYHELDIMEVSGGFITSTITLEYGEYEIQEIKAYDDSGKTTHYVADLADLGGIIGMGVPFTQKIYNEIPWISIQLHCK